MWSGDPSTLLTLTKRERFELFIERLESAPAADSKEAALVLIGATLNGIEDEFSGVPFAPEKWQDDGRLYPPQEDYAGPEIDGVTEYRSLAHSTFIGANGAIEIIRRSDGHNEISKAGWDRKRLKRPK